VDPTGLFTAAPDFDVITEIDFRDRMAHDATMALGARPEIAARIAEDEARFLDRARSRMFLVETRTGEAG
jgi:hypothetical protein